MLRLRYRIVDVFTEVALEGNALAVFPDARGLSATTMQNIARELNLAETVFLFPPMRTSAVAEARIFTPTMEMQFAGHPTIGASYVIDDEGGVPANATQFGIEELVGEVRIRVERAAADASAKATSGNRYWLTTPPITFGATVDAAICAEVLGVAPADLLPVPPQLVTAGNPCLFIALKDPATVDRAFVDMSTYRLLPQAARQPVCVFAFAPTSAGAYSRMFAPEHGVVEDPATGSATGPLAAFMMKHGLVSGADGTHFVSEQGTKMGRRSLLHVLIHGTAGADGIEVGGYVTPLAQCEMTLPTP